MRPRLGPLGLPSWVIPLRVPGRSLGFVTVWGRGGGVHGGVRGAGVCTCLTDWAAAWALALLLTKRCTGTSEDVW